MTEEEVFQAAQTDAQYFEYLQVERYEETKKLQAVWGRLRGLRRQYKAPPHWEVMDREEMHDRVQRVRWLSQQLGHKTP